MRSYIPTNYLSQQQVGDLRTIVDTYIPDLHDPAAVEVLLVLLEVCHILEVSDYRMRKIFGARQLHALETWGDIVPPKRRPPQLRRAWVWVPNTYQPKLHPIAEDGTIRVYMAPDDGAAGKGAGEGVGEDTGEEAQPATIAATGQQPGKEQGQ
jgi:hypothetical protein